MHSRLPQTDAAGSTRALLPDSALDASAVSGVALSWVGMRGIALPIRQGQITASASIDLWVDLADTEARGIHMSRLYQLMQERVAGKTLAVESLFGFVDEMVESQKGRSGNAQIDISTDLLIRRAALVSATHGWTRYPLVLRARTSGAVRMLELEFALGYSSTCPSSSALAQHARAEALRAKFGESRVAVADIAEWLESAPGNVATAHAQRSEARLRVRVDPSTQGDVDLIASLIDRCEAAIGTPLQTAVKRVDEQAFARRNAEHLMFCEDAARKLHCALKTVDALIDFDIRVAHFESLHAHDAVAHVSRSGDYRTLAL